jgi:multidrug efflux system outer membrane protein
MKSGFIAASLLLLSGCTLVGPDYVKPEVEVPDAWRVQPAEAESTANVNWWRTFNDPVLDELVRVALENNLDVRIAAARIMEYAARVDIARAGLYPQLGYGGSASSSQASRTTGNGIPSGISRMSDNFQTGINLGWELDFWGRIQRATEAARADMLAEEAGRRSVILTLVSAVATSYIQLRNLDRQLEIAKETLSKRGEAVDLFEVKFQGGVISELEVAQVKSEYEAAAVTVPVIELQISRLENAISVLLGLNPGPVQRGKDIDQLVLPAIPANIPSMVLQDRPDIQQAEQQLIAANARIGVVQAEYFPRISLTGLLGFASADLSDLLKGASNVWNLGAGLAGPIFTGGQLSAEFRVSEAVQQQTLQRYLQTVQTAFKEVEDSLVSTYKLREELEARERQVMALRRYAELANNRYDEGYVSYIEVLDAERALFDTELQFTRSQSSVSVALISVYKAMGGGWVVDAETTADQVDFPPPDAEQQSDWKNTPARTLPSVQAE